MLRWAGLVVLIVLFVTLAPSAPQGLQRAAGIAGVVAPDAVVELVQEGFAFTEGPVGRSDGGIYFTDSRPSRIYRLDPNGKISIFRENADNADGLALNSKGDLFSAERTGKPRITRTDTSGTVTPLSTESPAGRPFGAPNDLILDSRGGIYFTDPGLPPVREHKAYVYYLPVGAARPLVIDDQMVYPNGLTLTADGKTLIVDDNIGDIIYAFDIQRDGTVKGKRPFAQLRDIPSGKDSLGDGIALDRNCRIYVTSVNGIQVFDQHGQYLGTIQVPRTPANVAFGGPNKRTLFITARQGLYKVQMLSQGPNRPGK
jgi:gluconolactonase